MVGFVALLGTWLFGGVIAVIIASIIQHWLSSSKGPVELPLIGHLYLLTDLNLHVVFSKLADKYGDVLRLKLFGQSWTIISSPDWAKKSTLDNRSLTYASRPPVPFFSENVFFNGQSGVVFSPLNDEWRMFRKLIQPLLSPNAVKQVNSVLHVETEKFTANLQKLANGAPFDPDEITRTFPIGVLYNVMYGKSRDPSDKQVVELIDWIKNFNNASVAGQMSNLVPFIKKLPLPAWAIIREWIPRRNVWLQKEIADVRARMANDADPINAKIARESFVGRLILEEDHKLKLSENALVMLNNDLVFAGADTTATTIVYFFCFMANHPQVLQRVQEEIRDKVPQSRLPNMEDEAALVYTNAVINELLRLRPPAPIGAPHAVLEDDVLDGTFIPKDSQVWYNIWRIHRHPQYWSEPIEAFDPDRFLRFSEKEKQLGTSEDLKDNPATLAHFGYGRRLCPGQYIARSEVFLAITHIAYRFDIEKPEGVEWVADGGFLGTTIVPTPFKVVLKARK
ncbi:cytochrome P450 [Cladochytrium replicatum]|nr:cytochrome P450 [Cladochytrium replicatum]